MWPTENYMIKNKLLYENSLERFLVAQEDCYQEVLHELRQGHKQAHWIWFIFPQLRGLGNIEYSQYYGLGSQNIVLKATGMPPFLVDAVVSV